MDKEKKPFHELVAQRLIEQLKSGTAPWQKPWEPGEPGGLIPINPLTGNRYKGINTIQLMIQGYTDNRWLTYKQATSIGGQVRKGEKGTAIQYWKFTEEIIKTDDHGKPVLDKSGSSVKMNIRLERPRVFYATVFNGQQIDGLPELEKKQPIWNSNERAEAIIKASRAKIYHGEHDRAFYRLTTDSIHLPNQNQFARPEYYYATILHELGHWTGHSSRLDRDLAHPFGSDGYAREELRAEIASMLLGDELGLGHDPDQHAAYVKSWITVLQNDPMEIFRAAADAEKIQGHIISLELQQELVIPNQSKEKESLKHKESGMHQSLDREQSVLSSIKSKPLSERIWLDISYQQKEIAKEVAGFLSNGQRAIEWDKSQSRWFAHPDADFEKLKAWLPASTTSLETKPTLAAEKTWLAIPYEHRDAVKQLAGTLPDGSKAIEWDKIKKCWYANPSADLEKLKHWLPDILINERQEPALSPEQEFADVLRSIGCVVNENHPVMDGKTHRINTECDKRSEKSGFYVAHLDGHPAGYVKNNRTGVEIKWKSKGYSLSSEERASMHAIATAKIQERTENQKKDQEQAVLRINKQLSNLTPVTSPTPYLQSKGIEPQLGIYTDIDACTTYIPAIDVNGKVWSMQYINEDGTKRFAKNSRKEGCFHPVGGMNAFVSAPAIVIAEGYATAASVSKALGFATISAFDSGNIEPVARALHEKFPDKPIIIMGDDDKSLEITKGINPGRTKAIDAANAVNGHVIFPIFAPDEQEQNPKCFTDFNDLAKNSRLGLDGIKRQLKPMVELIVNKPRTIIKTRANKLVQSI